jgi:hypothetical protein
MIRPIVLRPQRLEAELIGGEGGRRIEADWHEPIRGHDCDRTGLAEPAALEFLVDGMRNDACYSARPSPGQLIAYGERRPVRGIGVHRIFGSHWPG